MSEHMVRKQIYLPRKQLAKQRGVSEAQVIRQALEREAQHIAPTAKDSKAALEEIIAFALSLRENPEMTQFGRWRGSTRSLSS
jgi:hypothetical protein